MYPIAFPPTTMRPLPGGTSLISAQTVPAATAAVMTTESFDAPEGTYVCSARFTSPPQPMIHLNPLPTTQAQFAAIYPPPRVSTASLRYPATSKNSKAAEKQREAAKAAAAAAAAMASSTSPLASQGIDAPPSHLTGGLPPSATGPLAGIAGIGGSGMGFAGLGESMGKLSAKPSRPKNNLKNTSSNFVNRMMTHPELNKILAARTDTEHFTFMTNARSFFWLADTDGKQKESLARITFSTSPSCLDVNQFTRAHDRLDIVVGFVTGDLIWLDPIASRYTRINKGGCITPAPVTQVRWLPGSENLIMAAHADGTMLVYDRDREDSTDFVPAVWNAASDTRSSSDPNGSSSALQAATSGSSTQPTSPLVHTFAAAGTPTSAAGALSNDPSVDSSARPGLGQRTATASTATTNDAAETVTSSTSSDSVPHQAPRRDSRPGLLAAGGVSSRQSDGSETEREPLLLVTKPGAPPIASGLAPGSLQARQFQEAATAAAAAASLSTNGMSGKGKETPWARLNPVSHWAVSRTRITDFAFSPDFSHVAIVAEDGILRIANINTERLLDVFHSYFGGLHCVVWSPDAKFVLTGGQDDLVTVWSPREGRIVARCQGHTSFVTGLAWDPWRWSSDDRTYRFGSVGEDCKLILWDFSSAALNRPKSHAPHLHGASGAGSTYSLVDKQSALRSPSGFSSRRVSTGLDGPLAQSHSPYAQGHGQGGAGIAVDDVIEHPSLPRSEVAILQPTVTVDVDGDIPTALRFGPDKLVVVRKSAAIDTFTRPSPRRSTLPASHSNSHAGVSANPNPATSIRAAMLAGSTRRNGSATPNSHRLQSGITA
ncbi:WD40 repeat-like protein [Testicularia cyperi]|uniref:WD40 repeat-like protein n=1 Tax=Testicularia cyperi TaxID=1882483 RepID=A0A317XN80_9BASI|nr:WD40 repeat-like protein [Testicularia cyperi]